MAENKSSARTCVKVRIGIDCLGRIISESPSSGIKGICLGLGDNRLEDNGPGDNRLEDNSPGGNRLDGICSSRLGDNGDWES